MKTSTKIKRIIGWTLFGSVGISSISYIVMVAYKWGYLGELSLFVGGVVSIVVFLLSVSWLLFSK